MDVYAGYELGKEKLLRSASGGAASVISENVIKQGGVVFGAAYTPDFYSAVYMRVERPDELDRLKGSKYIYVDKDFDWDRKRVSVYEAAILDLEQGKLVLFVGLGCDIAALRIVAKNKRTRLDRLYTLELLCDGVMDQIVQKQYVTNLENVFDSKVVGFNVRNKKDGWERPCIFAEFENGKTYSDSLYGSGYGFAFINYKKKCCYTCPFKGENHQGDIIVGDYWGCRAGMETYNKNGVSLLILRSAKGKQLFTEINSSRFFLKKVNKSYAFNYNPRYYTPHKEFFQWDMFDRLIREKGLGEAVKICSGIYQPQWTKSNTIETIALWGTGNCFKQYISLLSKKYFIRYVVDSDRNKWGKELECGFLCDSPDVLKNQKNIPVVILIENASAAFQVAQRLLDMGIQQFDYIENWKFYAFI